MQHSSGPLSSWDDKKKHIVVSRVATTIGPTKTNKSIFIILISDCHVQHNHVCCFLFAGGVVLLLYCYCCFAWCCDTFFLFFLDYRFFVVTFFSLCFFFFFNIKSLFETKRKRFRMRREKKIHLNAIFITLSCNIGVNLFGSLMARVYVCVLKFFVSSWLSIYTA